MRGYAAADSRVDVWSLRKWHVEMSRQVRQSLLASHRLEYTRSSVEWNHLWILWKTTQIQSVPHIFTIFFQQFFILICNSRKRMSAPNEILYLSSSFMSVCCSSELPFREKYENYVSFENKSVCLLYRSPSSVQYLLFSLQNCEKSQKVHIQSTAV